MKARRVTGLASVVRADNPGVMTLDGTNTWILRAPDASGSIVVDPGPADRAHLAEVMAEPLADGELIEAAGLTVEALRLPGHTADSAGFIVRDDASLLTGDTVLGFGTSVVAHPDGALGPYLASLERIRALAEMGDAQRFLPGHGPEVTDPRPVIDYYIAHRLERLGQVRAAVSAGATTAREVVEQVYTDVDESLWPAAELTVQAQLDYLTRRGG